MATVDRWLLPDGIEEVLPPEAARIEAARRQVLDLFHRWGYEFVVTPHIEYLESLLTGAGQDLDLRTFKVTDPASGRLMGFRADISASLFVSCWCWKASCRSCVRDNGARRSPASAG